jgi:hypothetical protein
VPRRVREHLQAIEFWPVRVGVHFEGARLAPTLLPFLVELLRPEVGHRIYDCGLMIDDFRLIGD